MSRTVTKPTTRKARVAKPKPSKAGKKRATAKSAAGTPAKVFPTKRFKPYVPTECPLCGSKRIEVLKRDTIGKALGKTALGAIVQVPLRSNIVNPYNLATCKSCGWRDEVML